MSLCHYVHLNSMSHLSVFRFADQLLERQPAMSSALSVELWHESYLNAGN